MMLKRYITLLFISLSILLNTLSQVPYREVYTTWEDFLDSFTEEETIDDDVVDFLQQLKEHPLNLNTVDKETLSQLPFLTEEQIDSLLQYRTMKKRFLTMGELQFISGWDIQVRRYTSLFTYIGDTLYASVSLKDKLLKGNHQIESRLDIPTYERKGNKLSKGGYLGDGLKNVTRYRYNYKNSVKYGITCEKDDGEPFATQGNNPFDHHSFYFAYRTTNKRHNYIVGDFTLHIGEGLMMGKSIFGGHLSLLRNSVKPTLQLKPHTGTDEHNYFRGLAYSYTNKYIKFASFASYLTLDAKIENNKAVTLYTSGTHRTYKELKHKNSLINTTFGAFIEFYIKNLKFGFAGYATHYDKDILPQPRNYNKYAFRGNLAAGGTFIYNYKAKKKFSFSGELSADKQFHMAYSHRTHYKFTDDLCFTSQLRLFSKRYTSPFAKTISQASKVANEQGVTLGVKWRGPKSWDIESYLDAFRFPFTTSRAKGSSHGIKSYVQTTHTSKRGNTTSIRYTYNLWQENNNVKKSQLAYEGKHRLRLQYMLNFDKFKITGLTEGCMTHSQTSPSYWGVLLAVRGHYTPTPMFSADIFTSVFNTDNYASSVYAYEPLLPGMYSFGTLYDKGIRVALQAKYNYKENYTIGLRYGLIHYFEKNSIGSELQTINSSSKGDFNIYFRMRF